MAAPLIVPGYRVWLEKKIGREKYWSWERADGLGMGANYPSELAAKRRAIESLLEKPLDEERARVGKQGRRCDG